MEPGFMELLSLQSSEVLISKAELLDKIRCSGRVLTERTLTYYTEEDLIPKPARFGRSAAFPAIAAQLVSMVVDAKSRSLSSSSIRELVVLWKILIRERQHEHSLHLDTLEEVARTQVRSEEASASIPWLVDLVLNTACSDCVGTVMVFDKLGRPIDQSGSSAEWINFMLTRFDPDLGKARLVGHVQLTLPGMAAPTAKDPRTVVIGTVPGTEICDECPPAEEACAATHSDDSASGVREEALA